MSDDPLAALEAEYEEVETVDVDETEEVEELGETEELEQAEEVDEEAPPGMLGYEDYIAKGGDPELFKGKKAYEAEYKRIQEVKELKRSMKAMGDTLETTVSAIAQREEKAEARHRKELEAALNRAKEDGDTDAALDAAEQLHSLKSQPVQQQTQTHPVIAEYIEKNPVLMNEEVKNEFARVYNGKLKADGVGAGDQLSEAALKGYARAAMAGVKQTFPEKFASPKNQRQTTLKLKAKPAATQNVGDRIKSVKIDSLGKQNIGAANDLYEMLKEKDPAQAEIFAKRILGEK